MLDAVERLDLLDHAALGGAQESDLEGTPRFRGTALLSFIPTEGPKYVSLPAAWNSSRPTGARIGLSPARVLYRRCRRRPAIVDMDEPIRANERLLSARVPLRGMSVAGRLTPLRGRVFSLGESVGGPRNVPPAHSPPSSPSPRHRVGEKAERHARRGR